MKIFLHRSLYCSSSNQLKWAYSVDGEILHVSSLYRKYMEVVGDWRIKY